MAQDIESIYDEYMSKLKRVMPNVDPNLVHRIMYVEREIKNQDVREPFVSIIIEYKKGTDLEGKMNALMGKYAVKVEHGDMPDSLHVQSLMKINKIQAISSDSDILRISGKSDVRLGE